MEQNPVDWNGESVENLEINGSIRELRSMDLMRYRLISDLDNQKQINYHSWKENTEISVIAKFSCKISYDKENIVTQSWANVIFVLRGEMCY